MAVLWGLAGFGAGILACAITIGPWVLEARTVHRRTLAEAEPGDQEEL
jgi:hypothetical protein